MYNHNRVFALDLSTYAVMSNYYHVVQYVHVAQTEGWSREEVIIRWHQVLNGTLFSQRYLRGETLSKVELRLQKKWPPGANA